MKNFVQFIQINKYRRKITDEHNKLISFKKIFCFITVSIKINDFNTLNPLILQ